MKFNNFIHVRNLKIVMHMSVKRRKKYIIVYILLRNTKAILKYIELKMIIKATRNFIVSDYLINI